MGVEAGTRDESAPLRFQRPSLPPAEQIERHLSLAREAHWLSNGGPCWQLLREALGKRAGAFCVPVASGTAGLMAALAATCGGDRAPGERVALLPSFTFPATVQAALWAGLSPRLLDVDPHHWHLAPEQLEYELRTHGDVAVVIAVSSFGTPPPPDVRRRWETACSDAGVPLVVDSAAGFGAVAADGVPIGAQGDVEIVSFHATKPFAIGEGGAVFTRDPALCERLELVVNFGLGADRRAQVPLALNGKLSELHAATGLAVLERFDELLAARRAAAEALLRDAGPALTWQREHLRSTWQFVPVAYPDATTSEAAARRSRASVETRRYYLPLHEMEAFRELPRGDGGLAETERLASRLLCFPMANDLDGDELAAIACAIHASRRTPALAAQPVR